MANKRQEKPDLQGHTSTPIKNLTANKPRGNTINTLASTTSTLLNGDDQECSNDSQPVSPKEHNRNKETNNVNKEIKEIKEPKIHHNNLFLKFKPKLFEQIVKLERYYWNSKHISHHFINNPQSIEHHAYNRFLLNLIANTKNLNLIYEYFNMMQFQKCCILLQSYYHQYDRKLDIKLISNERIINLKRLDPDAKDSSLNIGIDEKMTLYYCTICALYPCLYVANLPSSTCSILIEKDEKNENQKDQKTLFKTYSTSSFDVTELETTSEGLCDFLREIFSLSRPAFNDYQIKALKRLLFKSSHPQIVKDELYKQIYVIEKDKHTIYKLDAFQSIDTYKLWKTSTLKNLNMLIANFSHVELTFDINDIDEIIKQSKYSEKLSSYIGYYEKLLNQIFIHLKSVNRHKLTSNSKRLLKEFQLRYLIDPFHILVAELNSYVQNFEFDKELISITNNYLSQIFLYLNSNYVETPMGLKRFGVLNNDLFSLIGLLSNIEISAMLNIKDLKTLYPDGNGKDLHSLIHLIEEMTALNEILNRTSALTIEELITNSLEEGLNYNYREMKTKLKKKYCIESQLQFDSNLTYSMLLFCREYFIYSKSISKLFSKHVNICKIFVNVLYKNLMNDVKGLCEEHLEELKDISKVNLNLLALANRLNQFDVEWQEFITQDMQEWRSLFLPQLTNWLLAIGEMCLKIISNIMVPSDTFNEIKIRKRLEIINEQKFSKAANRLNSFRKDSKNDFEIQNKVTMDEMSPNGLTSSTFSAFKPFNRKISLSTSNTQTDTSELKKEESTDEQNTLVKKEFLIEQDGSQTNKNRSNSYSTHDIKPHELKRTRSNSLTHDNPKDIDNVTNTKTIESKVQNIILIGKAKKFDANLELIYRNIQEKKLGAQFQKPKASLTSNTSLESSLSNLITLLEHNPHFPCSNSFSDLIILTFRFKETCQQLIDFIIPSSIEKTNIKFLQIKSQTTFQLYKIIYQLMDNYLSNIFVLDICATSESVINKLFGTDLLNQVFSKDSMENLWGCRHQLRNSTYSCQYYINRETNYISDLYEPINEMMCVRLNNLIQLKEFNTFMQQKFKDQIQKLLSTLVNLKKKSKSMSQSQSILLSNLKKQFKLSLNEQTCLDAKFKAKLNKIKSGLTELLAYRLNLFCNKAITILCSEDFDGYQINNRLKPLTDFLTCNFEMLKKQCYPSLFQRLLSILWNLFTKNFTDLLISMGKTKNPRQTAHKYLQTINILINHFKLYGCKVTYLQSKVKKIVIRLQLYSHDSVQLILLYYKLFNLDYRTSVEMLKKTASFLLIDLPHLIQMKKTLKKPISGKYLVSYLKKLPPPSACAQLFGSKRLDKDSAIRYAQTLLEENYLISITPNKKWSKKQDKLKFQYDLQDSKSTNDFKYYDEDIDNEVLSYMSTTVSPAITPFNNSVEGLNVFNYRKIFLATKLAYFKLHEENINRLINSLLNINTILNSEIDILFPQKVYVQSNGPDDLLETCLENVIDYDFIMHILWHRIHEEPIVMKFISLRHSNYTTSRFKEGELNEESPLVTQVLNAVFPIF